MAHTPGPWAWFGEAKTNSLYLATNHSGRRFVMQFARWGLNQAQPRFQVNHRMVDASMLLQFEVCDAVGVEAAKKSEDCYRLTISGIDHPDARLIAAAPALYEALESIVNSSLWSIAEVDSPGAHTFAQQLAEIRRLAEAALASATPRDPAASPGNRG